MALLMAFVIALIPLAIAPGVFFYFDVTPKVVLLLLGTAAAAIWWAATNAGAGFYNSSREARWFVWGLGACFLSLTVSTAASVNPALSLGGSSWRYWGLITQAAALLLAYLVAAIFARRPDSFRMMLRALAASGFLGAIYGIAQYFGWDPLLDPRGYHVGEGVWTIVRPPSTLGHADYFANWLLCAVFAAAALAPIEDSAVWKWMARASMGFGAVAIVLSGTRAALIGLVAGFAFLIVWRGLRLTKRMGAVALVCALAAVIFYVSPPGALLRARVHWILQEPAGGARFLLWRDSLRMAGTRLPIGYGPETYITEFARYQSPELGRAYPDFYHESPHNMFLDVLVSQGLLGMLALLGLLGTGFAAAWKLRGNPAAGALAAGLLAMTLSGQFACFMLPTALAYYVTIALVVSLTAPESRVSDTSVNRKLRMTLAAPCSVILLFFGIRMWMAESELAAARRDLDWNRVTEAAAHYEDYRRWSWPGASADLWYSRRLAQVAGGPADRMVRIQAFQQAGAAALRATKTSDAPFNAYYNLAAFYARQNDFARTEESLRTSISYAPNWFKTHWMLAQVLQAASRIPEAEAEAATAVALDGNQHAEVTHTLDTVHTLLQNQTAKPPHK